MQTRPCGEEASCGTIAVYDRNRKRVGTILVGQMPESEHPTMTRRLSAVIQGVQRGAESEVLKLRNVTDAGCHAQAYYRDVLCKMNHSLTNRRLKWTWCEASRRRSLARHYRHERELSVARMMR